MIPVKIDDENNEVGIFFCYDKSFRLCKAVWACEMIGILRMQWKQSNCWLRSVLKV